VNIQDQVVLVTGGGRGIGRALAHRFRADGAQVLVADLDAASADAVASEVGGHGFGVDMGSEASVTSMLDAALAVHGRVDVFCSNAGILSVGGFDAPEETWQQAWQVNFMAHVYAARRLIPAMLERGGGAFVITASAAGLLSQIGGAPYAATKHATVAFAEWLHFTHADQGLRVVCICPLGVRTAMLEANLGEEPLADHLAQTAVEPEVVADAALDALHAGRFLALPDPKALEFFQGKAMDYDRWLSGMNRLKQQLLG
jgi:NAD(P)-dependent dehydrogenase (short-subunit alcohol dehydrogenase family)